MLDTWQVAARYSLFSFFFLWIKITVVHFRLLKLTWDLRRHHPYPPILVGGLWVPDLKGSVHYSVIGGCIFPFSFSLKNTNNNEFVVVLCISR